MKLVKLDPPGTWCLRAAFYDSLKGYEPKSFIEVGPGEGGMSMELCSLGLDGTGIDSSGLSVDRLSGNMRSFIEDGRYRIIHDDAMRMNTAPRADLVFSLMVMEHIKDDLLFLDTMKSMATEGGRVVVAVPARMDRWGIEDEIYGHFRRYESDGLYRLMESAGFRSIRICSAGIPVSNILFSAGNFFTRKSMVSKRKGLSKSEQTDLSSMIDVAGKTMFPVYFRLVLNSYTMSPFMMIQKLFYRTNLGLTLVGSGTV